MKKSFETIHISLYMWIRIPHIIININHITSISVCLFSMAENTLSIFYSPSGSMHQRSLYWSWQKREADVSFHSCHLCYFVHSMKISFFQVSFLSRNCLFNEHGILRKPKKAQKESFVSDSDSEESTSSQFDKSLL